MPHYRYSVTLKDVDDEANGKPTYDISNAVDISTEAGIEAQADSFNMTLGWKELPNIINSNIKLIPSAEDIIKIYFSSDGTTPKDSDDNLIMVGKIDSITFEMAETRSLKIKGINQLEALLNFPYPAIYTNKTSAHIVNNLIEQANTHQTNTDWVDITWDSSNPDTVTPLNSQGNAMPTFNYYQNFKPVFQMIEEVSRDEFTGDGTYQFYLKNDYNFVWQWRPSVLSGTLSEGHDFISIKATFSTYDVVNAMIIDGGYDFNGHTIFALVINTTSIGKLGAKWKFVPFTELSDKLKTHAGVTIDEDHPFGNVSEYSGGNQALRNDVRTKAKEWGQSLCVLLGNPRWKLDLEINGVNSYVLGSLYKLVIPSIGWETDDDMELRIVNILHSFTRNGWTTTLHFEQDETTAISKFKEKLHL